MIEHQNILTISRADGKDDVAKFSSTWRTNSVISLPISGRKNNNKNTELCMRVHKCLFAPYTYLSGHRVYPHISLITTDLHWMVESQTLPTSPQQHIPCSSTLHTITWSKVSSSWLMADLQLFNQFGYLA